jgi:cytochrome P450
MADDLAQPIRTPRDGDPWSLPLESLDPSDGTLYQRGPLHDYFKRLRREGPVHWSPTGPTGPYWCATTFNDILAVDQSHGVFSSDRDIVVGDQPPDFIIKNFIQADPPVHDAQRRRCPRPWRRRGWPTWRS